MAFEIEHIHVGSAIDERRRTMGITKTELGRRICVPQQHVNRLLERDTMETNRLIQVSEALQFNFFQLFCPSQGERISANNAAFSINGNVTNNKICGHSDADLERAEDKINSLKEQLSSSNKCATAYEITANAKDSVIAMMQEKLDFQQEKLDLQKEKMQMMQEKMEMLQEKMESMQKTIEEMQQEKID